MCRARLCLLKAVADAGFVEIHFPIKFTLLSDMQYASVVFLEHEPVRGHQHRLTAGRLSVPEGARPTSTSPFPPALRTEGSRSFPPCPVSAKQSRWFTRQFDRW